MESRDLITAAANNDTAASGDLITAAANNHTAKLETLLNGIDPNVKEDSYGITALHAAVQSRHPAAVDILLKSGASKELVNRQNETPIDLNKEFANQEICDLLNPDSASIRALELKDLDDRICKYQNTHPQFVDEQTLKVLATQYLGSENVPADLNEDQVLGYIIDAIQYMTLHLLEAEKYDSDINPDRWNHDSSAELMLKAISACSFFLESKNAHGRLPGIDWKTLSLYVRESQYDPNFYSNVDPSCKKQLVHECLHSMLNSNELEMLRKSIEDCRLSKEQIDCSPLRLNALLGFLSDEYNIQIIENAIQNFANNNSDGMKGKAGLLRSFINVGEALKNASSKVKCCFDPGLVQSFIDVRDFICHPEKSGHRQKILELLQGVTEKVVVIGRTVNLNELAKDLVDKQASIEKLLTQYKKVVDENSDSASIRIAWQRIEKQAESCTVEVNASPRVKSEKTFDNIKSFYDLHICKAKTEEDKSVLKNTQDCSITDRLSNLEKKEDKSIYDIEEICAIKEFKIDQSAMQEKQEQQKKLVDWFKSHFPHESPPTLAYLKNPQKAIDIASKALATNRSKYEEAKSKEDTGDDLTAEEKKLKDDYLNVELKHKQWAEYSKELEYIQMCMLDQKQIQQLSKSAAIKLKILSALDDYLFYAHEVEHHFNKLKDFIKPCTTSSGCNSGAFSCQQDHHVLEFYQIMVGSLSRWLIEVKGKVEQFKAVIPGELSTLLENTVIIARGYLAHIGIRQKGKASQGAMDRPDVFFQNSKAIIESMRLIATVKEVACQNLTIWT